MLIGGDDISNDVINLSAYFHVFFNLCLHSRSFPFRADSIHGNFFTFTCVHMECSFVFFLNRLTANEIASISKAVLEIEANAVIYI